MKSVLKKICVTIAVLLMISTSSNVTFAMEGRDEEVSAKFIELYGNLFNSEETYELFDRNDVCITTSFRKEYIQDYKNGNYKKIEMIVAKNGYILQFGKQKEIKQNDTKGNADVYIYSAWRYVLVYLDDLSPGKTNNFMFRVKGHYVVSPSNIIVNYYTPEVEEVVTYPGDLFSYTTWFNDTTTGGPYSVSFGVDFYIRYQYPYCNAIWQTCGPYASNRAVGYVW